MSTTEGDILVIVVKERNENTGKLEEIVSHGISIASGKTVILPSEHPSTLGAVFDPEIREYLIRAPSESRRIETRARDAKTVPQLSLAEKLQGRGHTREFIMVLAFDQSDIAPHIPAIQSLAAHIPKFWNVPDRDRKFISELFSSPKIVGGSVRFSTSHHCSDADQLRLEELVQEFEKKSHGKAFLLPGGGKIHCNLALGGEKQSVIRRYQEISQSSSAAGDRALQKSDATQKCLSLTERLAKRRAAASPDTDRDDSPGHAPRAASRYRG